MSRIPSVRCRFLPRFETLEDRTLLATCTVTNLLDVGRGGMSLGSGQVAGDLRFCINYSNNLPGPDVIDFTVTGTINLTRALPDLDSRIDIQGPGSELMTIDAHEIATVFYVEEDVEVRISGLTVTGGRASNWGPGGGIYNEGELVLQGCSILQNEGFKYGGGIYNEGILQVSDCLISENKANFGPSHYSTWGGGIYNAAGGTLSVLNSRIANNNNLPSISNEALGAGIANLGNATLMRAAIVGNLANPTNESTGAGWGGGIYNGGDLSIYDSLIAGNTVAGDYYADGGGICNGYRLASGGRVFINNSTIAENLAWVTGYDNYINPRGGAISSMYGGAVIVHNSTIAGNRSDSGGELPGHGGGISKNAQTYLRMQNTILADNTAVQGPELSGNLTISGFNLIRNSAGGSGYDETDILNVDPTLGPLADNGGPTQTMALLPGSPAIDAGNNNGAPEFDQRGPGFPRIVNGTIDIGAFEVQATGAPGTNLAVLLTADFSRFPFNTRDVD